MLRRISSVFGEAILPLPRTLRPELWGIPPAILLAGFWFGAKGALVASVAALPLLLFGAARAPRSEAASLRGDWRDEVSGMPLRMAAVEALDAALAASALNGKTTACLVIGLDEPQEIVERYGQEAHDRILRRTAERLAVVLRERDCLARLEGDRFAVALAPVRRADLESLIQVAARMQAAVREPVSLDAMTVYVSASIGFCLPSRLTGPTGAGLLAAAEAAMEDARRNGPVAIRAYSPEVAAAASDRALEHDRIEAALEKGEIVAWFQPQLSTDTGEVTGFEALARWMYPERGVLPPADFLPAVQEAGLAGRLGEVMLFHALTALRSWDRVGYPVPSVAVNFCREELRNPRLAEKLHWELDRFELAPNRLTVEILESVVAETESDAVIHTIAALSCMGCGIDLDDFGTGHASITSIRRFAVGRIKIDRSFVTRVDSDPSQQRMIAAILSMAERLGLATLAEGVETVSEHAMLAQLGCGHVQGYAIARPMPFADTVGWLERHRSKLSVMPAFSRRTG